MSAFRRLLIANRGEVARRVIRTAHRMGLQTVAVYSDADAGALHGREATLAVPIGGRAAQDSYLRADKLIAAARASGADAVHPGYGFLSEDPGFAQAVLDAGLVWIGPPPAAMRRLGNKASGRQLARALDIPMLPGYDGDEQADERLVAEAARIGFPVMVKAAAGGGGRGMRLVRGSGELRVALASARSEAQAAFGDATLLLERALLAPRHVEVQVVADAHGHCIHLGERDCSVQRRHQKIVEEAPGPAVDAALRERLGACAVRLVQAAGYVGAGTVEFLMEGGDFHFMEVNARLQVEHPVTEALTGIDLVEWQLRIAAGEPLPLAQDQVRFAGHAIEVRLCAEDDRFAPHAGTVRRFRPPAGVRFDHALAEGLQVPPYYDSLLGKLVAHATTRAEAVARLAAALDELVVLGLPTNRRLLAACLRHPDFAAGRALIPFLEERGEALRRQLETAEEPLVLEAALAAFAPGGGAALPCPFPRPLRVRHRGRVAQWRVHEVAGGMAVDQEGAARVLSAGGALCAAVDARRRHVQIGSVDLLVDDASFEPPHGAGAAAADEVRAPFSGKVIAVQAQPGAAVLRGEPLLVLESMKLEHALVAPRDGIVAAVHAAAGQQAAPDQVLVSLRPLP